MYEFVRRYFGPNKRWHFDGHGINRDGKRILKSSLPTHIDVPTSEDHPTGLVSNPEHNGICEALTEYASVAHRCSVNALNTPHGIPEVFLEVDQAELEKSSLGATVLTITVNRKDNKAARFHVRLYENKGRIRAVLAAVGRREHDETERSVAAKFADWETPLEE